MGRGGNLPKATWPMVAELPEPADGVARSVLRTPPAQPTRTLVSNVRGSV